MATGADDEHSCSFIVKVWLEDTPEETVRVSWRGHITHVPGGERHYFDGLERLPGMVAPCLERLGVRFGWWTRARFWLLSRR